jgi:outer membrane lipoprotein-sorting protein
MKPKNTTRPLASLLLALTLAVAVALLQGAAAPALAAQSKKAPDPMKQGLSPSQRLQALLERVKYEQKGMKTLEARFVQQQESSLLAEPEESTGVFSYAAPDRVRWEYLSPNPISVVVDGDQMTTWYRDLKQAEKLKIGRYSNQVFKYLGASGDMDTLLQYFNVTLKSPGKPGEPFEMKLVPRYDRIAKRIESMTVWIDSERFFPTGLKYVEAGGDVTEYRFSDFKLNAELPADRFELKLPKEVDTRVVDLSGDGGGKNASNPKP